MEIDDYPSVEPTIWINSPDGFVLPADAPNNAEMLSKVCVCVVMRMLLPIHPFCVFFIPINYDTCRLSTYALQLHFSAPPRRVEFPDVCKGNQ